MTHATDQSMTKDPVILPLAAMLAAMVLLPIGDAISKLVVATYPAEQITWVRNLVHVVIVLPLALRGGTRIPFSPLHLFRAFNFALMAVAYIAALRFMPLADAQALIFTFPLMVMVFSALALGLKVGPVRWTAALAGLAGVVLVVQPGFREMTIGVPLALLAAVSAAAYILLTRRLTGSTTPMMMLAVPGLISVLLLTPVMPFSWIAPDIWDLSLMIIIGLLSTMIHFLLIFTYARLEPSSVAPLAYLQIAVGVVLGWWIFGDLPNTAAAIGMIIVVLSGIVISVREHRGSR
ncbi:MAG: DMT family transporter [Pseudomonadota bacterium]